MSRGAKLGIVGAVVLVAIGAVVVMGAAKRRNRATEVRLEQVKQRDLVASVTASGKIDAETSVDVSADISGRITKIGVKEGDLVRKGQFLLQIDPAPYEAAVSRAAAQVASSKASAVQAKANMDQAERANTRAKQLEHSGNSLISPEAVEQAQTAYEVAQANYQAAQAQVQQAQASLDASRTDLGKTRLMAPMDGRVVRLPVHEGEVAVPGTFSRENGLLMTIADLSVILAKVQVDETDVVRVARGDSVQVSIDAFPDTSFTGRVTKISNSAQLASAATGGQSNQQAVDYDVEVTLDHPPEKVRPDLSATAKIITATRKNALSIPIIALTVRDNQPVPSETKPSADTGKSKPKEAEGVFVVRNGLAYFRPVKVGIAGEEYFEVLDGLQTGDTVVAGPYQTIRDLKDSARVHASGDQPAKGGAKS
jgi:HlyD family secretion protein